MQHQGSADELPAKWSLAPGGMTPLDGLVGPGRLGLSVQLASWRQHSRFPADDTDLAPGVPAHLAAQGGSAADIPSDKAIVAFGGASGIGR